MKRLSSDKAKKILEFLIKKRLGIAMANIIFKPYFSYTFGISELNDVEVEILYNDGKRKTLPFIVEYHANIGFNISHVTHMGSSFAKLLRWMEKRTQRDAVFGIDGIAVFTKHDSIESILIEMELEDSYGN